MTYSLEELRGAIGLMIGDVDRVLSCGDGLSVAVIIAPPVEDDPGGFCCVSLGLSNRERTGEIPRAELLVSTDGMFSDAEIDGCARDLARLARVVGAREGRIDDVFSFDWQHVYTRMNAIVLTEYMLFGPDYLFGIEPEVRLLAARPLFEREARWVAAVGSVDANDQFNETGTSWNDPYRAMVPAPLELLEQT